MSSAIRLHSDGTSTRTSTLGVNTHLQFPYRDRTVIWWRPFLIGQTALRHCILDEVHSKPSTFAWALLSGSCSWGLYFFFLFPLCSAFTTNSLNPTTAIRWLKPRPTSVPKGQVFRSKEYRSCMLIGGFSHSIFFPTSSWTSPNGVWQTR